MMPIVIGLVLLALLVAGGYYLMTQNGQTGDSSDNATVGSENNEEPVATVNGEVIVRKQFNDRVQEFVNNARAQGLPTDNAELMAQIESQALDTLINTELLLQKAVEANIVATSEAVDEAYNRAVESFGGEAGLSEALAGIGFTSEELRQDITDQLAIDAFLEQATDLTTLAVSEEEVSAYYDEISATASELPPLTEIAESLRNQLLTQKQQQTIVEFIESLRAEANIEILIQ